MSIIDLKRTWAEIDLEALAHNFHEIKARLKPQTKICCVVKADGYGHGAVVLCKEYEELGADWFAVSNLEEASQLRAGGIRLPILILGYTPPAMAGQLDALKVSQAVYSLDYARELSRCAVRMGVQIKSHIKVDTGMSRIGFFYQHPDQDGKALEEMAAACRLPGLVSEGIFTHFAAADEGEAGRAYTQAQYHAFCGAIDALSGRGITFTIRHCANSAAVLDYPEYQLDMVRPGIILYGLSPSTQMRCRMDYRPVMTLKSVLSMVKEIQPGVSVSYGRRFTASRPMTVGTVPIGYADGYPRALCDQGAYVLVHGRPVPIIGRICMDQLMVDPTGLQDVRTEDEVELFGLGISAGELAEKLGTISYELLCNVSKRVPRVYWKNGASVERLDYICDGFE